MLSNFRSRRGVGVLAAMGRAAVLGMAAFLASCGGGTGSGGTIFVSLDYSGDAYIFRDSTIQADLSGFDGHSPNCSLGSGRLPAGMSVKSNCSISGTPTESGSFGVVVRVGASNVSNNIDWNVSFTVFGPSVTYLDNQNYLVGQAVDLRPINSFWQPTGSETLTYSIASGSLPAGVSIEPATGRIYGVPSTIGSYSYTVRADIVSNGRTGSAVQQAPTTMMTLLESPRGYSSPLIGWLSEPLDVSPVLARTPGATFFVQLTPFVQPGGLPAGLTLDAGTGRISGTPTHEFQGDFSVDIDQFYAGQASRTRTQLRIETMSPVYINYPGNCYFNLPCVLAPTFVVNAPFSVADATYQYQVAPGSTLSAGLALDSTTGVISGTALGGSNDFMVEVRVSRRGVTFVIPRRIIVGSF